MPDSKAAPQVALTRERIVEAAVSLADDRGIDALSMRAVAKEVGVEAMSLYHHLANKEALLDGMVDAVFGEIELPAPGDAWPGAMRARARSARAALRRHPWAIGLMDSRRSPGPATLRHHDAVLGCLIEGGLSLEMAGHAVAMIDAYVYGFVLQELALPFETSEEMEELAEEIVGSLSEDEYPHLVGFVRGRVLRPGYAFGDEFAVGLDLVLDGLERSAGAAPADA